MAAWVITTGGVVPCTGLESEWISIGRGAGVDDVEDADAGKEGRREIGGAECVDVVRWEALAEESSSAGETVTSGGVGEELIVSF
jgi:hypothetical protein